MIPRLCDVPDTAVQTARALRGTGDGAGEASSVLLEGAEQLRALVSAPSSVSAAAGAEALIKLYARPPVLVEGSSFVDPPQDWAELLEQHRGLLDRVIASTARIENAAVPDPSGDASAFVVADGVVLTNRHVVNGLTAGESAGWAFLPGYVPALNFAAHVDEPEPRRVLVDSVIGVHPDPAVDVALLAVSEPLPPPLPLAALAASAARERRWVCTVGHPKLDPTRNDAAELERVFGGVFDVKRVSPGETVPALEVASCHTDEESTVFHDCSTLGGSSGSCLVDLSLGAVVGVHYCGQYRVANAATSFATLAGDPLFVDAGVTLAA